MSTIDLDDSRQVAAGRQLVARYLSEAHATETALVTTLQVHLSMTPRDEYRTVLERHLDETREHARAIRQRLRELDVRDSFVGATIGFAETIVGQAVALAKGPIDIVRGSSREEKLLKNAKDECATEALEIGTYDALESLARAVGDEATAALAARHREEEERMLAALRRLIPSLTQATVQAAVGRRS
jgi:ferritin-like metal-binding protein YciE